MCVEPAGKIGRVTKEVAIHSNDASEPVRTLSVVVDVEGPRGPAEGVRATAAVFSGPCADCHARPAEGLAGRALYDAVCEMCHGAPAQGGSRAPLKPLKGLARARIESATAEGLPAAGMPAFAAEHGGPLGEEQIGSLADYLLTEGE